MQIILFSKLSQQIEYNGWSNRSRIDLVRLENEVRNCFHTRAFLRLLWLHVHAHLCVLTGGWQLLPL